MQIGYFSAAWQDIKNSPGWFGKLLLLSLVSLIPIFGWIVVAGYLYGWARDIAWGVHGPLPTHLFGNEDGKLYSRGFFVLVIGFVCSLLPWIIEMVGGVVTGMGFAGASWHYHGEGFLPFPFSMASGLMGLVFFLVSIAAMFFAVLFYWVGTMRMSIYGRLSAGFQFGKMWAMIRHDFGGILRIFGMALLMSLIIGIVVSVLVFVAVFISIFVGFLVTGGNMDLRAPQPDTAIWSMAVAIGGFAIVLSLLFGYISLAASVFVMMVVTRAIGYWTRQFDVPAWRGQDDPMPFELVTPPPYTPYPPQGPPPAA